MSKHSSRGAAWVRVRARVLARDHGVCGYCGAPATTVDHVVAKANGGTDDPSNLIACCKPCNSTKGARVMTRLAYHDPEWISRV